LFLSKDANIKLGIGSNMCKALRYYLRATELTEEIKINTGKKLTVLTEFGKFVINNDPNLRFLETIALIHLHLCRNQSLATSWYVMFNKLDNNFEITSQSHLLATQYYLFDNGLRSVNDKLIDDDFICICNSYCQQITDSQNIDPENIMISPFNRLNLLKRNTINGSYIKQTIPIKYISNFFWLGLLMQDYDGFEEISIDNLINQPDSFVKAFNLKRNDIMMIADSLDREGLVRTIHTSGLDVIRLTNNDKFNKNKANELFAKCYKQKMSSEINKYEY
jgi:hypothetical protein